MNVLDIILPPPPFFLQNILKVRIPIRFYRGSGSNRHFQFCETLSHIWFWFWTIQDTFHISHAWLLYHFQNLQTETAIRQHIEKAATFYTAKKRFFGVYCCLRHRAILQVSQSLLMLHSSENSCYCFFDWCGIPASRSVCATVPSCVPFIFVMNLYWIHIFTNIRCPHRLLLPSTMKKGVGGDVIWLVAMTNRLKYISGRWMGWPIRPPRSLVLLKRRKHVYSSRHSVRYNVGCKLIGNSG